MGRENPLVVMFYHHWDDPVRRDLTASTVRAVTDSYGRHGVRAHYGFVGVVLQQLEEDAPDTVAQIKQLKMPIGYHGGAGHHREGPVGHPPDTRGMGFDEAVRALWSFETHTLTTDSREPIPGRMGGYLAIQSILGVIPLPTDAKGTGRMDVPGEFVLTRMGAGSYPVASPYGRDAVILSPLHEPHLFPDAYGNAAPVPPTYYGKDFGVDAPLMAQPADWFDVLAANLPDDQVYVVQCMTHAGIDIEGLDQLLEFLASRPEDFNVTHPDPDGTQWRAESSASSFYRRTYGIESLKDVMALDAPPEPLPITVTGVELAAAADSVLSTHLLNTHDGDFAEPAEFVDLGSRRLSLAQTFQALVKALSYWAERGELPGTIELPFIHGPVDYPQYDSVVQPELPDVQMIGYTPTTLPIGQVPNASVINRQGLPPAGDYHVWMPTHTLVEGGKIVDVATQLDVTREVPGVIEIEVPGGPNRGLADHLVRVALNPAEFMYGMAQIYRRLVDSSEPGRVGLVSIKVAAGERTECVLVKPGGPRTSFIWRSPLTASELDAAWTRAPMADRERILWMSLPPLGDKVKELMGRAIGAWQRSKR